MGNYKGGYGYAPFIAAIDYGDEHQGEILPCHLRPGNADPNQASAHIALSTYAIAGSPTNSIGNQLMTRRAMNARGLGGG